MSIGTNAIVDKEFQKNNFCKFVEDELKLKLAAADEEFIKSIFCKFSEVAGTNAAVDKEFSKSSFHNYLLVVEDVLEQKALSIHAGKAIHDHFLNRYFQNDPLAHQIMEIACGHYLKETVSPL